MENPQAIIKCEKIVKSFSGVRALKGVNFDLAKGEIHGLVGENGAGKSTLVKIISGVYSYDSVSKESRILYDDNETNFRTPNEAIEAGIMMIHQEISVIPHLTVYENVYLNHEQTKKFLLKRKDMIENVQKMIDDFGVEMDAKEIVKNLSADKKKLVEILKAFSQEAKILIMDEPTSVLNKREATHLFSVMHAVAEKGIAIIFISHDLSEVMQVCDRVTVLRNGSIVGTFKKDDLTMDELIQHMIGKKLKRTQARTETSKKDKVILSIEGLERGRMFKNISFNLHEGEILGIAGLVGSGGLELSRSIFGVKGFLKHKGEILIKDKVYDPKLPSHAIRNNIALLTDDRKNEGLFLKFSVYQNITIPITKKYINRFGFLKTKERIATSNRFVEALSIRTPSSGTIVESLSGGNQQKVVIAKWLELDPDVFVLNEPTAGIDLGAKTEIREIIIKLAEMGKGMLIISNETNDLISLCDRVLVMYKGEIVNQLDRDELSEDNIQRYVVGGVVNE